MSMTLGEAKRAQEVGFPLNAEEQEMLTMARKAGLIPDAPVSENGMLKAAGSGAATGFIGAGPGLLGDTGAALKENEPHHAAQALTLGDVFSNLPTTADTVKTLGIDYKPQNKEEGYAKSISQGMGSMALPYGPGSALMRMLFGAASGAAGEGLEGAMGKPEGAGRIIGEVSPSAGKGAAEMALASVLGISKGAISAVKGLANGATARGIAAKMLNNQGVDDLVRNLTPAGENSARKLAQLIMSLNGQRRPE